MMIPHGSIDEIERLIAEAKSTGGKRKTLIARAQVKSNPKTRAVDHDLLKNIYIFCNIT